MEELDCRQGLIQLHSIGYAFPSILCSRNLNGEEEVIHLEAECSLRCWILGSVGCVFQLQAIAGIDSCSPHTGQFCLSSLFYPVLPLPPQKVLDVSSYWEV